VIAGDIHKIAVISRRTGFFTTNQAFLVFSSAEGVSAISCTCRVKCFLQIPAHSFETFFRFVHYTLGSTRTPR
jgi:hypothetical protein